MDNHNAYFIEFVNDLLDNLLNNYSNLVDDEIQKHINFLKETSDITNFKFEEDFYYYHNALMYFWFLFPIKECQNEYINECKKHNKIFLPYVCKKDHIIYESNYKKNNIYLPEEYLNGNGGDCEDVFFLNHKDSPHRYPIELLDDLYYNTDKTINVIDCGSSEGILEILIASRYENINRFFFILIDPAKEWNQYIKKTLKDINAKYIIINKFLDDTFNLNDIDVDEVHFIKMDIEGGEVLACKKLDEICKRDHPIMAICTYHNQDDYNIISNLFKEYNYSNIYPSKNYMLFINNPWLNPPFFRRGLCIAHNLKKDD